MVYIIVVEFPNGQGNIWEISPKIPFVRCFRREGERRREEKVKFELKLNRQTTRDLVRLADTRCFRTFLARNIRDSNV